MRETRQSGSAGGAEQTNAPSLPLSFNFGIGVAQNGTGLTLLLSP